MPAKPLPPHLSQVAQRRFRRLRSLAHLLDNAIEIPIIRYRVGLDPLLGLLPVGGDVVGFVLSLYVIVEAARLGVSQETMTRMVGNIAIDSLVGTVPVAGDWVDVAWKANAANLSLLEQELAVDPRDRTQVPWWFVVGLLALLVALFVVLLLVGLWLLRGFLAILGVG